MYFLQIWRLRSPRTRCQRGCALGRTLICFITSSSSLYPRVMERVRDLHRPSHVKALITSQHHHLLYPHVWGLEFNMWILKMHKNSDHSNRHHPIWVDPENIFKKWQPFHGPQAFHLNVTALFSLSCSSVFPGPAFYMRSQWASSWPVHSWPLCTLQFAWAFTDLSSKCGTMTEASFGSGWMSSIWIHSFWYPWLLF